MSNAGIDLVKIVTQDEARTYFKGLPPDEIEVLVHYFRKDVEYLTTMSYTQAKILNKHLAALGLQEAEPMQSDEERIEMWAAFGLAVSIPKGRCEFSDSLMLAEHGGVPYCVDDHSKWFKDKSTENIDRSLRHLRMAIEVYHEKIKNVYEYCTELGKGPVWVMMGGGAQVQAFFGCAEGYLAILFLDLESAPATTPELRSRLARKHHILQPKFSHNEELFKKAKIPGVRVKNFDCSWKIPTGQP